MFHELGHFLTAKLFNWKIDKIYIYPLGGITRFNDEINKPFIEEFLVAIMGPVFQIIITILLRKIDMIVYLSKILLAFNLLPILPLDGGRIINIFLSFVSPYKKSLNYTIKISYIVYFLLIFFIIKISSYFFILVFISLIFKINEEKKNISYYFNKFLLERYLSNKKYKRSIIISRIRDMFKYRNNIIKDKNRLYSTKEALSYLKEKIIVKK